MAAATSTSWLVNGTCADNVPRPTHPVRRGESDGLFLLHDETGECLVDPEGASVTAMHGETWFGDGSFGGSPGTYHRGGRPQGLLEKLAHAGIEVGGQLGLVDGDGGRRRLHRRDGPHQRRAHPERQRHRRPDDVVRRPRLGILTRSRSPRLIRSGHGVRVKPGALRAGFLL